MEIISSASPHTAIQYRVLLIMLVLPSAGIHTCACSALQHMALGKVDRESILALCCLLQVRSLSMATLLGLQRETLFLKCAEELGLCEDWVAFSDTLNDNLCS